MGGEGQAGQLAIECVQTMGLQGFGVQGIWWGIFLERKQFSVEMNDVRVGRGADIEFNRVRKLVAIFAFERRGLS